MTVTKDTGISYDHTLATDKGFRVSEIHHIMVLDGVDDPRIVCVYNIAKDANEFIYSEFVNGVWTHAGTYDTLEVAIEAFEYFNTPI